MPASSVVGARLLAERLTMRLQNCLRESFLAVASGVAPGAGEGPGAGGQAGAACQSAAEETTATRNLARDRGLTAYADSPARQDPRDAAPGVLRSRERRVNQAATRQPGAGRVPRRGR